MAKARVADRASGKVVYRMTKRGVRLTMLSSSVLLAVALAAARADEGKPMAPANPEADSRAAMKFVAAAPELHSSPSI